MKKFNLAIAVVGSILTGCGVILASTNPSQQAYQEYAINQIMTYLDENACSQVPSGLDFLQSQCRSLAKSLLDTGRPQIEQLIARNTQSYNYILFTVFKTDLSLPPPLPSYHFETVGVFRDFYIYQADQSGQQ